MSAPEIRLMVAWSPLTLGGSNPALRNRKPAELETQIRFCFGDGIQQVLGSLIPALWDLGPYCLLPGCLFVDLVPDTLYFRTIIQADKL